MVLFVFGKSCWLVACCCVSLMSFDVRLLLCVFASCCLIFVGGFVWRVFWLLLVFVHWWWFFVCLLLSVGCCSMFAIVVVVLVCLCYWRCW